MDCFWSFLEKSPRHIFCEEQLCSFIVEPANTWSNIGYLITAILIYRNTTVTNPRVRYLFLVSTFSLAIGSTLLHMTGTLLGKFADVGSMYLLSVTILTLAAERYFQWKKLTANIFYFSLFALSMAYLLIYQTGSTLFGIEILAAVVLEFLLYKRGQSLDTKKIAWACLCQLTAFGIWILDVKKIMCAPDNHILTGHSVWHLMSAVSIWIYYLSYRNLPGSRKSGLL